MLFLKRLSDTWDAEKAALCEEYSENIYEYPTIKDYHQIQIPEGCHWNDLRRAPENHGALILKITKKIEQYDAQRSEP